MNDMLALTTAYLALIAILIGHSIYTSRRLKLVEERLAAALEADERRGKKRTNEEPARLNSIANNVDSKEE
ncbi:MAG: hypothetical protein VYE51_04005 [Candidatus Thermoplasmatota archaeon]|nr:hypothetical protein [Candidatus Thermoplasmatota archaeon]MEC7544613.1 hypothetical protein [Candidatus Thermoplasmatota archaeon]MEC7602020.1 hypothetical protein [Candidatus Thermoplasmatota archaeon]MEC8384251.1 hypothetical protein [Candidatus Thermoplasmatota archaeon]MEC8721212.1 hypothetical protein [Candidatus Thermoplasmatota archaeon]